MQNSNKTFFHAFTNEFNKYFKLYLPGIVLDWYAKNVYESQVPFPQEAKNSFHYYN